MSLFGFSSDRQRDVNDLCDLSTTLAKVMSSTPDDRLTQYERKTSTDSILYKTPDLCLRYMTAVNALDVDGEPIINEYSRIRECCSVLKKMIDSYTNHVCDLELNENLDTIKEKFDHIEKISANAYGMLEDDERKLMWESGDRFHVNRIVDFQKRRMQEDYDIGIRYIKRRQFLRREIYKNLINDPNMLGKDICTKINEVIESADREVLDAITPRRYRDFKNLDKFVPGDIYAEWNFVKSEIANGTFGQNYPDNVPDDYDEAKKYLQEHDVSVLHPVVNDPSDENVKEDSLDDDLFEDDDWFDMQDYKNNAE